jgi:tetratricopeptide (TPR) repeat protein
MKTVFADYNAMTESGHLRLGFRTSQADIAKAHLHPGDWTWLSDGEVMIGAQLAIDDRYGMVGIPDWDTLVHLDDEDSRDFEKVRSELERLLWKPDRSLDKEKRVLQLLTISEIIAPPEVKTDLPPGYFASRRAETLVLLGKPELALPELEEARRLSPDDADDVRLLLDILRRIDLPRARREAEALAAQPDAPAGLLAECINVLATYADSLPDEQFRPVADRMLEWADRFDRAAGREQVLALTLALIQFNRGMILLRLGRTEDARDALNLARSVDPILSEIAEATRLTSFDQHARDLAARVRSRPSAA